ncbi:MAG: helix-turn-helix domain-containing protein [Acutalibacteraceae bacterium]|nr:helix-turn-helix domain-containing protein [Acutalibacteraceae bacterium]
MDQKKIGAFLKELRTGKSLTQEQLAEKLGVAGRTVSRWENGNNMPDLSIMVELADFYDVDIRELLNGERKSEKMDKDLKETLEMVADYSDAEKTKILNNVYICGLISTISLVFILIMYAFNICSKDEWLSQMFIYLIYLGIGSSIYTVICGLQLKGKMSKERLIRVRIISSIICLLATVLVTSVIVFLISN